MSEERGGQLLVLTKISRILDSFSLDRPELGLTELRRRTGLPASTLQRLVASLVEEGFLDRAGTGYRIGARLAYWAAGASGGIDLLEVVRPVLEELRDLTGETACFYQPSADLRVCTAVAETRHDLRRPMRVGQVLPLHAGSAGRVMMAFDERLADRVLSGGLDSLTDRTITDGDTLRGLLAETRELGYAVSSGERESGATGLSAPVFDAHRDVVGAVTVMGPAFRLSPDDWVDPVRTAAERITRMIGGRRAPASPTLIE
ncbi:IclR family transcriptional regulator [Enemella evansiae]|uniref:IclR family transcriptional regulator n=1 Tax=Enemella evansiae TaxID=2016499 RepID=A0A255G4R0_9ACTN|nr:IclR family transcriptional regulator [Enemella evansiae]OYN98215.1 IclR family transcriptional regulator [Enemella evansiae]OYO05399.1 IclR family transcriptional regulator [Enemella evansiae]OYO10551.1 IclR family transcriptional regulator [Enemella evansiae]